MCITTIKDNYRKDQRPSILYITIWELWRGQWRKRMSKWNYILLSNIKVTYSTKYEKVPKFFFGYMVLYYSLAEMFGIENMFSLDIIWVLSPSYSFTHTS